MKALGIVLGVVAIILFLPAMIWMGTYNGFMRKDQGVIAAERRIASCYQKRADLLTNLEATVERYATHERGTFGEVTAARAGPKVVLPENPTPEQRAAFEEAVKASAAALVRINAVSERYPDLKADKNFMALQTQLQKTENECNILRVAYINTIQAFNTSVHTFPSNLVAGVHGILKKDQMKLDNEEQNKTSPRLFQKK